jgi:hypothetical protein
LAANTTKATYAKEAVTKHIAHRQLSLRLAHQ